MRQSRAVLSLIPLVAVLAASCVPSPSPSDFASPVPLVREGVPYVISTAPYDSQKVDEVMAILRTAYQSLGIVVTFEVLPGERSLMSANEGGGDAELHRIDGIQARYPNLRKVNVALAYNQHSVFTKGLEFSVNGYASLKKYHIGYTRGFKAIERGTAEGFTTFPVDNDDLAFKMLNAGRVDVVVTDHDDGMKVLARLGLTDIHALPTPVEVIALYHYVNVKHADLVPRLEEALKGVEAVR